jgi:hypothetical protein
MSDGWVATIADSDGNLIAVGTEDGRVAIYIGGWQSADGVLLDADQCEEFSRAWTAARHQAERQGGPEMARPEPPEMPEGCHAAAVPDPEWRLASGKPCRMGAGKGRPACGQPSVAELNRGYSGWRGAKQLPNWWAYCGDHLYGRWIEDGQVMHWIAVENDA